MRVILEADIWRHSGADRRKTGIFLLLRESGENAPDLLPQWIPDAPEDSDAPDFRCSAPAPALRSPACSEDDGCVRWDASGLNAFWIVEAPGLGQEPCTTLLRRVEREISLRRMPILRSGMAASG